MPSDSFGSSFARFVAVVLTLAVTAPLAAQSAGDDEEAPPPPTAATVPSNDIWRADLDLTAEPAVTGLDNVTDRDGYDNQPQFLPDGSGFLYSSVRGEQTDIYQYDFEGDTSRQVVDTPTSEYSPTVLADGKSFSVIREASGVQQLWRYGLDGDDHGVLFGDVQPVGYQAWIDGDWIAVFVLSTEEGAPHTLQLIDGGTGEATVVAENPGRSIHRIPGTDAFSFVEKVAEDEWWIVRLDPDGGATTRLTETLEGSEDYAWTPDGSIVMGSGSKLFVWSPGAAWREIADLEKDGLAGITRLAVARDGSRLAIVSSRE